MPDINLNSKEWLDLVFEGRNKLYGAYRIRRDSNRRYMTALGVVVALFVAPILCILLIGLLSMGGSRIRPDSVTEISNLSPVPQKIHAKLKNTKTIDRRLVVRSGKKGATGGVRKTVPVPGTGDSPITGTITTTESGVIGNGGAPSTNDSPVTSDAPTPVTEGPDQLTVAEQLPEFPGGIVAFMKWLTKNLQYPSTALQQKIEGKVVVSFVVNQDGSISRTRVETHVSPELDQEALRLLSIMPKWTPGIENGKPCRTMLVIPIVFKIM